MWKKREENARISWIFPDFQKFLRFSEGEESLKWNIKKRKRKEKTEPQQYFAGRNDPRNTVWKDGEGGGGGTTNSSPFGSRSRRRRSFRENDPPL